MAVEAQKNGARRLLASLEGKRAVLFDFDGTLVDSIGVWNETDLLLARELSGGTPSREEVQDFREQALVRFAGEPEPYRLYCACVRERYHSALSVQAIYDRRTAIAEGLLAQVDYKPGADRFLWYLRKRGFLLALVTTGRRESMEVYRHRNRKVLEKAPLDEIFTLMVTAEDVARKKPDPELYLCAMERLHLGKEQCLAMEDSLSGLRSAKAAGLETAVVRDPFSDRDWPALEALADFTLAGYEELAQFLPEQDQFPPGKSRNSP